MGFHEWGDTNLMLKKAMIFQKFGTKGGPVPSLLYFFPSLIFFSHTLSSFRSCNKGSSWGLLILRVLIYIISRHIVYHNIGDVYSHLLSVIHIPLS